MAYRIEGGVAAEDGDRSIVSELVRFSFPLSQRMQTFLQLQDGLQCLAEAERFGQPYLWLQSCADIRMSLAGDQGRKPALPEILALLESMQVHLGELAAEHPRFEAAITASRDDIKQHLGILNGMPNRVLDLLAGDALISGYLNALKKQDWLGHKLGLPQTLPALWENGERRQQLHDQLQPLQEAVGSLNRMLHDYVGWESRLARGGGDQLTLEREGGFGLLIIGLDRAQVGRGIMPDLSGNRIAVRVRFQLWAPGKPICPMEEDVPYHMMLVPVA